MADIRQTSMTVVDHVKHTADAGAVTITLGALSEILPPFAALLSVIWMMIRIYETRTVQKLLGNPITSGNDRED